MICELVLVVMVECVVVCCRAVFVAWEIFVLKCFHFMREAAQKNKRKFQNIHQIKRRHQQTTSNTAGNSSTPRRIVCRVVCRMALNIHKSTKQKHTLLPQPKTHTHEHRTYKRRERILCANARRLSLACHPASLPLCHCSCRHPQSCPPASKPASTECFGCTRASHSLRRAVIYCARPMAP